MTLKQHLAAKARKQRAIKRRAQKKQLIPIAGPMLSGPVQSFNRNAHISTAPSDFSPDEKVFLRLSNITYSQAEFLRAIILSSTLFENSELCIIHDFMTQKKINAKKKTKAKKNVAQKRRSTSKSLRTVV